jgi:hypothetical protein
MSMNKNKNKNKKNMLNIMRLLKINPNNNKSKNKHNRNQNQLYLKEILLPKMHSSLNLRFVVIVNLMLGAHIMMKPNIHNYF